MLGYITSRYIHDVPSSVSEFFLALTAAMSVHLLDRLWLFHDTEESFNRMESTIVRNVLDETRNVVHQLEEHTEEALRGILTSIRQSVTSLDAMTRSGIAQLYQTRESAAIDIAADLTSASVTKIRIIGISLNDFVLHKGSPALGDAWSTIRERIAASRFPDADDIDLKILFIDPSCLGAQLRSMAEARLHGYQAGRLGDDVRTTIEELWKLENQIGGSEICRMYRLPPILFLVLTDTVAYVQQYYFWSTRIRNEEFPVFRFQKLPSGREHQRNSIHSELEKHFDWIWTNASIGLREYHKEHSTGTDGGILQSSLINIYCDPSESLKRMMSLLSNVHNRVSIQGISLHSFFSATSSSLFEQISRLLLEDKVYIDVMFLNPECEQAKFRAYREFTFARRGPAIDRSEYFSKTHGSSTLFADTEAAIDVLKAMVEDIAVKKGDKNWVPKLRAARYASSPYCFIMRTDNHMLVEQYHYGKLSEDSYGPRIILGKDLPLMEYVDEQSPLCERAGRLPFDLLVSHLDFVMAQAEKLPVEQWAAEAVGDGR
jgi:hypothetical protein